MPNTPASLQDIAARLGVHPSTVSRALRNHPAISEAVRLRVQAVAREFAYKPNPLIAALVRSRKARRAGSYRANLGYVYTAPVGRVTAWRKDYDALFSGALTRARFLGYELEEFNLSGTRFTPRRFTQILLTRNILGLILPPLYSTQDALPVDWEHFGVISIGHSHAIPAHRVVHNHFTAMRTALAACRQRGRQRIGFVLPRRLHEKVGKLWLAGYVVDQFEHGGRRAQMPPLLIENEAGHAEFAAWLRRHRPDAIVGLLNLTPLAQWVEAAGLAGEVELVTLDHGAADGGFGGIFHDHPRIGATAVDQLVSLLERNERGLPAHPTGIYIEGRWVEAVAAAAAKTAS